MNEEKTCLTCNSVFCKAHLHALAMFNVLCDKNPDGQDILFAALFAIREKCKIKE